MQVSAARTEARDLVADPSGNVLTDALFLRHINKALAQLALKLNDSARTTVSLVQGQREYALGSGILSIEEVHIVPENNLSDTIKLIPRRLDAMPYQAGTEADPTHYYIQPTGGTNSDEFSLFVWPAPARSTADALIVDYKPLYEMVNDVDYLPFPSMFHGPLIQYASGSFLADRDDDKDVAVGERMMARAMTEMQTFRTFQPALFMASSNHRFG